MFTVKNVQAPEDILVLAEEIHKFLKMEVHTDDIEVAVSRGHQLNAYMANTGKMLADAKYWKDKATRESVLTQMKDFKRSAIPASIMNELIKSETKDLNYLVNWIEQMDKEVKYQVEWLRSCISKAKEEMRFTGYGNSGT
jgi:lipopolysaccharide biosynthesis glycosyltransferase